MTNDVAAIPNYVVKNPDADFTAFWPAHKESLPDSVKFLAEAVFLAVGTFTIASVPRSVVYWWYSVRCWW